MLPKLSELFKDSNKVVQAFLARLKDYPYGFWYAAKRDGMVRTELSNRLFRGMSKRLGSDELTGLMPMLCTQPSRGRPEVMLANAYDESVHAPVDIRDEKHFREKRLSFGTMHPDMRSPGAKHFYGGFESNLDPSSLIRGPMYLGSKGTVHSSAKIIGPVVIGDRVLLNTSSVLTRTILGSDSQIDDLVSVKDSIIGTRVYIMTGAKLLHRESLESESVVVEDFRVSTRREDLKTTIKRHKIGAIVGDGCVIGANAVLGPGTILMPGVRVPHGLYVPSGIYDQWGITHLKGRK